MRFFYLNFFFFNFKKKVQLINQAVADDLIDTSSSISDFASIANDIEVLKRNTELLLNNSNSNNLIRYPSMSLSTSSTSSNSSTSSQSKLKQQQEHNNSNDLIVVDPTVCKYLNKVNHHDELVDLFNNNNNNNNNNNETKSNDNPFTNDNFIDLFSKTNKPIDSKMPPSNLEYKKINENDLFITNPTNVSKSNNYQSIIDLFDPIKTNDSSNTQIIESKQQLNSNLLPKPFDQRQYMLPKTHQQQQQQIMSSVPSYNEQQTQASKPQMGSYLSYAATPFYGFNQRPQFGYHSVAYPVTPKSATNGQQQKQQASNSCNKQLFE